jgi:glycosyltransferase involved in cell wall biosynthesis
VHPLHRQPDGSRALAAGSRRVRAPPSYANEGVPQALLAGLPCITTTAGSISELASHEATALVVPQQNAHALGAALERLIGDPDLRRRLGEAARAHCAARFSEKAMLDRMEAIYASVAASRTA